MSVESTAPDQDDVAALVRHEGGAAAIADEFLSRTRASRDMHARLRRVLPAGETRSVTYYRPYPVAVERGAGPLVFDVDGRRYIDVLNNYTSLVHGHAYPPVVDAVCTAMSRGSVFPAPHQSQLDLAELLVGRYPAAELVRFTNSGTEAALLALRLARRATGRRRVVVFRGGYHGGAADFIEGAPEAVHVAYNDVQDVIRAMDTTVAAVFVEPFLGSGGVIPARDGFLSQVQQMAHAVGALVVLDEVQSLRNSFDGVHGSQNLQPDLLLLGKIIGGGLPVGAVAGRTELMELTAAHHPDALTHSGTFNGNVLSMTAGTVSLRHLDDEAIQRLNLNAAALALRIEQAGAVAGFAVSVTRAGSIMHLHFLHEAPTNAAEAGAAPTHLSSTLHLALLAEGLYAAPRGMLNLSTALTADHLDEVGAAYERALLRCAAESPRL
jgi:glutamate-1-semialdehyde 2,1-aminomutase